MIHITSDYYYKIEDEQYTLVRKYTKNKGVFGKRGEETDELVERTEELGYFNTVEFMLRRLARILVREKYDAGEIKTLREHIEELRKMREELRFLLKGE